MSYTAPQSDIEHILTHIIEIDQLIEAGMLGELERDLLSAVLEEAGKFAGSELAPLNKTGDEKGCTLKDGTVTTPPGWGDIYTAWQQAGWAALSAEEEFGGQNLPHIIAQAVGEYWNSANMAFGLCPLLTQGAVDAISHHGSDQLKATYLPKMVAGEWTGTMNLTEPQAGSDLAAIRTKAIRAENGTYLIKGTKIFITYGDHELTENIIHLVLARLPDAPEGTRGISLFLVPKFLLDDNGNCGARNDVLCTGLEKKLGIHGSPTCVMTFGSEQGAVGYLVGEENRGLHAMFTMMNLARLSVGTQGVAIMERALQQARTYAEERQQGTAPGSPKGTSDPIINHPDIRSSLAHIEATIMACRAICLMTARNIDIGERSKDEQTREAASNMAALLTPIAKSFATDASLEITSSAIQVHGGMGFVEETGAAQHYRDARILPIYEGTNGIQAIDLMFRKLPLNGGETITALLSELRACDQSLAATPDLAEKFSDRLTTAINDTEEVLAFLNKLQSNNDPAPLLYAATPTLKLMGLTIGAALLVKGAVNAAAQQSPDHARQTAIAALYAGEILPQTSSLKQQIISAANTAAPLTEAILQQGSRS